MKTLFLLILLTSCTLKQKPLKEAFVTCDGFPKWHKAAELTYFDNARFRFTDTVSARVYDYPLEKCFLRFDDNWRKPSKEVTELKKQLLELKGKK